MNPPVSSRGCSERARVGSGSDDAGPGEVDHAGDVRSLGDVEWMVLGASVRGAQHRRDGRPNQDAIGWWPPDGVSHAVAVAVADGHGHPRGVRAERGAAFAVEAALAVATAPDGVSCGPGGAAILLSEVPYLLSRSWSERVRADLEADPPSEDELELVVAAGGDHARDVLRRNPQVIYGTTVVLAVATPAGFSFAQLGDGDVLIVAPDGQVQRPLGRDDELIANRTWSLAMADAPQRFRTAVVPAHMPVEMIIVATDGYSNSYRDAAGFDQVGADMLSTVRLHGPAELASNLPGWLEATSGEGSGDDISVGVIMRLGQEP